MASSEKRYLMWSPLTLHDSTNTTPTKSRLLSLPLLLGSSVSVLPYGLDPVSRLHPHVDTILLSRSIASGD
jgi:hypothetical protein